MNIFTVKFYSNIITGELCNRTYAYRAHAGLAPSISENDVVTILFKNSGTQTVALAVVMGAGRGGKAVLPGLIIGKADISQYRKTTDSHQRKIRLANLLRQYAEQLKEKHQFDGLEAHAEMSPMIQEYRQLWDLTYTAPSPDTEYYI